MRPQWHIGVDEVGRGALAGPLTVAAVAEPIGHQCFRGIRDSKCLTEMGRKRWEGWIRACPHVRIALVSLPASTIDRWGMSRSAMSAVARVLVPFRKMSALVLLDGGLIAPRRYRQMSIVRGDGDVPVIAAASLIAKVHRDRVMERADVRFPLYGFARHKGYGTVAHYRALERYGPSPIHRKTFRLKISHRSHS